MKRFGFLLLLILLWSLPAHAQEQLERVISQRFEYGEMIYRQSTGEIYVLYTQSGTWQKYTSAQYGGLPANRLIAPSNRQSPRNGFGRLWYGFNTVRNRIGWAVLSEIGFETRVMFDGGDAYFWRIDGLIYHLQADGTWGFADAPPEEPEAVSIPYFSVTPDDASIGDMLTIGWEVLGTPYALVEVYDTQNDIPLVLFDYQPVSGSVEWSVPETVSGDIRVQVHAAQLSRTGHSSAYLWRRVVTEEVIITVDHSATTVTTQAAYQRFDNGFMIWREDTGDVRVFFDNGTLRTYAEANYGNLPVNDFSNDNGCDLYPVNAFAIVWGTIDNRTEIGCPQSGERGYNLTINGAQYSLPDGRGLNLISHSSWSY